MPLNKPKYKFFKNTKYAFDGLKDIIQNESSFKIQTVIFFILTVLLIFLPIEKVFKLLLFVSLFFPIIGEIINSAIERVVDLVTTEYHEMAKRAKDIGATIVLVNIVMTICVWLIILYINIENFK